jgi:hypothetical protein
LTPRGPLVLLGRVVWLVLWRWRRRCCDDGRPSHLGGGLCRTGGEMLLNPVEFLSGERG